MATLLRYIIDDISETLKQTSDDMVITPTQIGYLLIICGNRLKSQHIAKRDSGRDLKPFIIPVFSLTENVAGKTVRGRKGIFLPADIFDFDGDRGIDYIAYESCGDPGDPPRFTRITFTRTTPKTSHRLYMNDYERPSPKNPYFYRMGMWIPFLGVEKTNVQFVEAGLYTTIEPIDKINIDEPFDFPDETVEILKRQVLDIARFSLLVPEDRSNDGTNSPDGQVPTNKLVSVNQAGQLPPEQQQ